jgi:hypothetical protein
MRPLQCMWYESPWKGSSCSICCEKLDCFNIQLGHGDGTTTFMPTAALDLDQQQVPSTRAAQMRAGMGARTLKHMRSTPTTQICLNTTYQPTHRWLNLTPITISGQETQVHKVVNEPCPIPVGQMDGGRHHGFPICGRDLCHKPEIKQSKLAGVRALRDLCAGVCGSWRVRRI